MATYIKNETLYLASQIRGSQNQNEVVIFLNSIFYHNVSMT